MADVVGTNVDSTAVEDKKVQSSAHSKRVETWVKNTQEFHQRNIEEVAGVGQQERSSVSNYFDSSDIEDDPDIDDLLIWNKRSIKPKKTVVWSRIPLLLKCEWLDCFHEDSDIENFVKHVSYHIPSAEIKTDEDDNDLLNCLWAFCSFNTTNDKEFVRHVNFHAYHTKLKCVGQKMTDVLNLPKCSLKPGRHNTLPEFPTEFVCEWQNCSRIFNNSQMFFFHVSSHMMCYREKRSKKQKKNRIFPCGWRGCNAHYKKISSLAEHMRAHTQEKSCACPSCGGLFSCATKLQDHCLNQAEKKLEYQCTSCFKIFPCHRLMREHMRRHVSRYKCSFCDMTCPSPSNLSLHIRYRHLNSKPFRCAICKFGAKCQRDLDTHLNVHSPKPAFKCTEEGCEFACRTKATLNKHKRNEHLKLKPIYCCHLCNEQFSSGFPLTKHLFDIHDFQWTPGHSRFTYIRNDDGFFRLKPFRLETLELTQEILQAEIDEHPASLSDVCGKQYAVHQLSPNHMSDLLSRGIVPRCHAGKPVVISIDEIDQRGDLINRKVMETVEVPLQARGGAVVWDYSDGDGVCTPKGTNCAGKPL